jgi:hypothetical protein
MRKLLLVFSFLIILSGCVPPNESQIEYKEGDILHSIPITAQDGEYSLCLTLSGNNTDANFPTPKVTDGILHGFFSLDLIKEDKIVSSEKLVSSAVSQSGHEFYTDSIDDCFEVIYNEQNILILFVSKYYYQKSGTYLYTFYQIKDNSVLIFDNNEGHNFSYDSEVMLVQNDDGNLCNPLTNEEFVVDFLNNQVYKQK